MFAYDWMATDGSTGTSSLAVNITFSCLSASNTDVSLSVTHASVDDPFFACNLGGCTPQEGDATLPRHPPTNGANPSYQGQHLQIFFVNTAVEEKLLSTNPGANALQVTSNAGLIGNSFDPAYTNATWAVTTTGAPWPGGGRTATNYKSWSLQKQ
jgi:hypothetical protein